MTLLGLIQLLRAGTGTFYFHGKGLVIVSSLVACFADHLQRGILFLNLSLFLPAVVLS